MWRSLLRLHYLSLEAVMLDRSTMKYALSCMCIQSSYLSDGYTTTQDPRCTLSCTGPILEWITGRQ